MKNIIAMYGFAFLISIILSALFLAGATWLVVRVLQWTGVL